MTLHKLDPLAELPACERCGSKKWRLIRRSSESNTYQELNASGLSAPIIEEGMDVKEYWQCEEGDYASESLQRQLDEGALRLQTHGHFGSRYGGAQLWPLDGGDCLSVCFSDAQLRAELTRLSSEGLDLTETELDFFDGTDNKIKTYRGDEVVAWLNEQLPSPAYYQTVI